jgi:hypothetical protein
MVIVMEYEANILNYDTSDINKMAEIDEQGFSSNLDIVMEMLYNNKSTLLVDSPWNGIVKDKGTKIC